MNPKTAILAFATTMIAPGAAISAEGPVVWSDATCDYFIIRLPVENPTESFGLFKSNTKPIPKVGDIVEGDIIAAYQVDVTNKATGQTYSLLQRARTRWCAIHRCIAPAAIRRTRLGISLVPVPGRPRPGGPTDCRPSVL